MQKIHSCDKWIVRPGNTLAYAEMRGSICISDTFSVLQNSEWLGIRVARTVPLPVEVKLNVKFDGTIIFPKSWNIKTTEAKVNFIMKYVMYPGTTLSQEVDAVVSSILTNIITSYKLENTFEDFITIHEELRLLLEPWSVSRFVKTVLDFDDMKEKDFIHRICKILEGMPFVHIYSEHENKYYIQVNGHMLVVIGRVVVWDGNRWIVVKDTDFVNRAKLFMEMGR